MVKPNIKKLFSLQFFFLSIFHNLLFYKFKTENEAYSIPRFSRCQMKNKSKQHEESYFHRSIVEYKRSKE